MKRFNPRELKLYCFSPFVMLATFGIEIALALWTIFRYQMNEVGRLVVALLVFLAIFQIAEFNVCESGWIDSLLASRIGYVAITMLPPLGIHLAYALAGAKKRPLLLPAYATAAAFITFFLFVGQSLSGHACLGNYVIFQMLPEAGWWYGLYYYGWLIAAVWLCFKLQAKPTPTSALTGLAVGYLAFMVPTTTVNFLDHNTIAGIPSIMCGFAVLMALTLVLWVLPRGGTKR
jgi:hypothetical protein